MAEESDDADETQPPQRTQPSPQKPRMTEIAELSLSINSSINHLFRLSILIRKQRPRGRLPIPNESNDLQQTSPDITNVMDKFTKTRQFPWLAVRLGNATSKRREFIQYRQVHRARLSKQPKRVLIEDSKPGAVGCETIATTFEIPDATGTNTTDSSTGVDIEAIERASVLSTATSFASLDIPGLGYHVPDLSDMVLDGVQPEYGDEFECPYCRTIQFAASRHQWKYETLATH